MCSSATEQMQKEFPELTRVRGYVDTHDRWQTHWWLETPAGEVVDPTAMQFGKIFDYDPLDESDPLNHPTGQCPNCGRFCYDDDSFCNEECENEYRGYLNSSLDR